jgi:hypothetical protein
VAARSILRSGSAAGVRLEDKSASLEERHLQRAACAFCLTRSPLGTGRRDHTSLSPHTSANQRGGPRGGAGRLWTGALVERLSDSPRGMLFVVSYPWLFELIVSII